MPAISPFWPTMKPTIGFLSIAESMLPLAPTSIVVLTNDVVAPLHGDKALAALRYVARTALLSLPDGESTKRWDSVLLTIEGKYFDDLLSADDDTVLQRLPEAGLTHRWKGSRLAPAMRW